MRVLCRIRDWFKSALDKLADRGIISFWRHSKCEDDQPLGIRATSEPTPNFEINADIATVMKYHCMRSNVAEQLKAGTITQEQAKRMLSQIRAVELGLRVICGEKE